MSMRKESMGAYASMGVFPENFENYRIEFPENFDSY